MNDVASEKSRQVSLMSLKWHLDDVFSILDRSFLLENKSRQRLVDYFNTIIREFCNKSSNSDGNEERKLIIQTAIEFHEKSKLDNRNICLYGKYHNVLFVAAKLCHQWDLQDTSLIFELLNSIYACEKTFEKFFECSIFGTKITQLISGWRSDYRTQDENLSASLYFLKHAVNGRFKFRINGRICNFIDVPMRSYENLSLLKTAVKAENWDIVILLLKYGAITYLPDTTNEHFETYSLLFLFVQKMKKYDMFPHCKFPLMWLCFKLFVRTIPALSSVWMLENQEDETESTWPAMLLLLEEFGIEYTSEPKSLKHLARCTARQYLAELHQLPVQYEKLNIPKVLESYLNLETD